MAGSSAFRSDDARAGPRVAARFRQQLPAARVELVDNANHIITADQPEVVERLLAGFLR